MATSSSRSRSTMACRASPWPFPVSPQARLRASLHTRPEAKPGLRPCRASAAIAGEHAMDAWIAAEPMAAPLPGAGDSGPGVRPRSGPGLPLACVPSAGSPCIPSRDGISPRSGRDWTALSRSVQGRRADREDRVNQYAGDIVISQPMRSPIHRQRPIRIFVHPHLRLHEMRAQPARWQLQP